MLLALGAPRGISLEKLNCVEEANEKVLKDMNTFISSVREFSKNDISSPSSGLKILRNIRATVYENLNQIQHEYLILQGLIWLKDSGYNDESVQWYWNPRQSGDATEPDLRAVKNGNIIVSLEATTSEKPQGVIDSRMRDTLSKLNGMEGEKFYFVRTAEMENRANTKVGKNGWDITVVKIEV